MIRENTLPEQWVYLKIGDVAEVVAGGTPKAGNPDNFAEPGTGIAWLTPADLSNYKQKYIRHGSRDLSEMGYRSSSAKLMPKGTLLFSSRAPIGYVAVAANDVSTNQGFKNFVFSEGIDPNYAYYFLRSIRDLAENMGTGTTFKEISGATAKKLPFILSPIAEQKIIADKLDTLLAQVETTKAYLERIPKILKRFRQSVLSAAVSGKLTEEWRRANSCDDSNQSVFVEEVAKSEKYSLGIGPFGSNLKVSDYKNAGHPLIFVREIRANHFGDAKTKFISSEKFQELKAHRALPGDVLITKMGDPPGDVAIYPTDRPEAVITADCIKLSVDETVADTRYVAYAMQSQHFRNEVLAISAGVAQKKVNLKKFRKLKLPLPSLSEQTEIVRCVDQLFTYADTIEKQVNNALERVNNLTQSILAKAFRGELTSLWRQDNPDLISGENSAEALLAKINAEREALKKQSKTRRAGEKKRIGEGMSKQIIKVLDALKEAGKPLSGQQLLAAAGYPSNSGTEQLEQFFLDIRDALGNKQIVKQSRDKSGQDWFALAEAQ